MYVVIMNEKRGQNIKSIRKYISELAREKRKESEDVILLLLLKKTLSDRQTRK